MWRKAARRGLPHAHPLTVAQSRLPSEAYPAKWRRTSVCPVACSARRFAVRRNNPDHTSCRMAEAACTDSAGRKSSSPKIKSPHYVHLGAGFLLRTSRPLNSRGPRPEPAGRSMRPALQSGRDPPLLRNRGSIAKGLELLERAEGAENQGPEDDQQNRKNDNYHEGRREPG